MMWFKTKKRFDNLSHAGYLISVHIWFILSIYGKHLLLNIVFAVLCHVYYLFLLSHRLKTLLFFILNALG